MALLTIYLTQQVLELNLNRQLSQNKERLLSKLRIRHIYPQYIAQQIVLHRKFLYNEVSDLLPSTDRKDQACSSNHVDLCIANRRFAPDIVKSVVHFCTPQTFICEFQICQEIFIQVPTAVCYIDSVHIQCNSAIIEVVCSMRCRQTSDAKRVSTAGFRTGIGTEGPHPVTRFATRLMCDARDRNMPWNQGIRVCLFIKTTCCNVTFGKGTCKQYSCLPLVCLAEMHNQLLLYAPIYSTHPLLLLSLDQEDGKVAHYTARLTQLLALVRLPDNEHLCGRGIITINITLILTADEVYMYRVHLSWLITILLSSTAV